MFAAAAIATKGSAPNGIKMLDKRIDERGIIGEDAVLKVALALGLRAHPRAGEIRAAEVRLYPIHDDALEMNARTSSCRRGSIAYGLAIHRAIVLLYYAH